MAVSQTIGSVKTAATKTRAVSAEKVSEALKQASSQAKKQLELQGLKLPTQSWTGLPVRNPVINLKNQ